MSNFKDAVVELDGQMLTFSAAEGEAQEDTGNYWHGPGDPSTWLSVAIVRVVQCKYPTLANAPALDLAAQNLGITVEKLLANIDWHEHYMQWHDGDPDYRVL